MIDRRAAGLIVALVASGLWLASRFNESDPISGWHLVRLAPGFVCAVLLGVGCFLAGRRLVHFLAGEVPFDELLPTALTAGLLLFFLIVFAGGVLRLFGPMFFVLAVAALWMAGLWGVKREPSHVPFGPWALDWLDTGLLGCGAIATVAAIIPVFALDNLSFDARWYHLALGEQYAVAGGLVDFREGSVQASVSHLTSWLDAWAFQLPSGLIERLMLTRWIEVFAFLTTLAGLPALARSLHPGAGSYRFAWVAFFLFPSIFVYDTALLGAADHVCAAFAIPAWLALVRFWERPSVRAGVLLALPLAGLALTKYTAVILVAPVGLAAVVAVVRRLDRAALRALGALSAALVALTAPHWLTNVLLRGSPLYPALCRWLSCSPWTPSSAAWIERYVSEGADLSGAPTTLPGALLALLDFSWGRYTFGDFHGARAIFGSLFTLLLPALLFLPTPRRVWALVGALHGSVLLWALLARQERYLLPIVPLMAGVVAVALSLAWQEGRRIRALIVGLVCVHLAGTADAPVLPTHRAHGEAPLVRGLEALGAGFKHTGEDHLRDFRAFQQVGQALPEGALVLMHRNVIHLGIGRRVMTDNVPHTLGLDYVALGTPGRIRDHLVSLGVTHVGVTDAPDQDSLAAELLFRSFVASMTRPIAMASGWSVSEIGPAAMGDPLPMVLVVGCGGPLANGLYPLSGLGLPEPPMGQLPVLPLPIETGAPAELVSRAGYVALDLRCASSADLGDLVPLGPRAGLALFARTVR